MQWAKMNEKWFHRNTVRVSENSEQMKKNFQDNHQNIIFEKKSTQIWSNFLKKFLKFFGIF